MLGGRFQKYTQTSSNGFITPESTLNDRGDAFLPQVGVVYKVMPDLSLYASYSKSFTPSTNTDDNGNVASAEKGHRMKSAVSGRFLTLLPRPWRFIASTKRYVDLYQRRNA